MPPSAITGVLDAFAASTQSMIAVSCGTPTPATIRVVQIEPGPMPTLMASAPQSINALAPSLVRDVPGDYLHLVRLTFDASHRVEHISRMAVSSIDHNKVNTGCDERLGAREAFVADGRRRGNTNRP